MINALLNRNQKKSSITKLISTDGKVINTPQDIAKNFNTFFSEIATKLKTETSMRNVNQSENDPNRFLGTQTNNSIFISPVDCNEVFEIIKNLKNKATLDTKISALKVANEHINFQKILANVVNASFEQGKFPQPLKIAKIVPIHKGGSKTDVANYRPISLLPTISKIYEKTMHIRITGFMEANNAMFDMQYGFRKGRSCEHALLKAQNTILESLNKKEIALLLLIDFSKAFDMVDHEILLDKLQLWHKRKHTKLDALISSR